MKQEEQTLVEQASGTPRHVLAGALYVLTMLPIVVAGLAWLLVALLLDRGLALLSGRRAPALDSSKRTVSRPAREDPLRLSDPAPLAP